MVEEAFLSVLEVTRGQFEEPKSPERLVMTTLDPNFQSLDTSASVTKESILELI